jgi:anti-sigma factor ChrR (cupin superfamily)
MMGMHLTCEETAALLSDFQEGVLPLAQYLKVRVHLFNCPGCRTLLATLRAVPGLAAAALALEAPPEEARERTRTALAATLARIGARPAMAAAIPAEARKLLAANPDLPMCLLARTHQLLHRERPSLARPYPLPQATLDQLPGQEQWLWQEAQDGGRKAELLRDPAGQLRLVLAYAPPSTRLPPHRHLGSESILVLDGAMDDLGRTCGPGDWVHHAHGSCHAPSAAPSGCWCLIREEGTVRLLDPADWAHRLGTAS